MQVQPSFLEVSFAYIADPKLRNIIVQFHAEAVSAFEARNYISAVILSGGILEGILTFGVMRHGQAAEDKYRLHHRGRVPPIRQWSLVELIEIATELETIGEGSAKAAQAIRDFRNLIHPSRLHQRSNPRWDALAALALSAVAEISRSLSGRMQS